MQSRNLFGSNLANRFRDGLLHETKMVESSNDIHADFSINNLLYIRAVNIVLSVVLRIKHYYAHAGIT